MLVDTGTLVTKLEPEGTLCPISPSHQDDSSDGPGTAAAAAADSGGDANALAEAAKAAKKGDETHEPERPGATRLPHLPVHLESYPPGQDTTAKR